MQIATGQEKVLSRAIMPYADSVQYVTCDARRFRSLRQNERDYEDHSMLQFDTTTWRNDLQNSDWETRKP